MTNQTDEGDYHTADEFLHGLGRRDSAWPGPLSWIFRGHGDSRWSLLPVAHRKPDGSVMDFVAPVERAENECKAISKFAFEAAVAGLWLPEIGLDFLERINPSPYRPKLTLAPNGRRVVRGVAELRDAIENWPPNEIWGVLALAQHYKWPTCLLDWTYDPKRAAYFAAKYAATKIKGAERNGKIYDGPEQIAVWGLSRTVESLSLDKARVSLVHGARHHNPRLLAQDGLFTVIQGLGPKHLPNCLDLQEYVRQAVPNASVRPYIHKVTLPAVEAPRLLRLLHEEFINAAVIDPGYEGVVEALNEQDLWDERAE